MGEKHRLGRVSRLSKAELSLFAAVVVYTVIFSAYTIGKYEAFRTGYFDFGQQVQFVWLLVHGKVVSVVLGRPILILVGSLFAWLPTPATLLVIMSGSLGLGALPLFYMARTKFNGESVPLVFAISYLASPILWGINAYEFHTEAFLVPLAFFLFYFYRMRKVKSYLASLLLSLLSSEFMVIISLPMILMMGVDYLRRDSGSRGDYSHVSTPKTFILLSILMVFFYSLYLEFTPMIPHYSFPTLSNTAYGLVGSSQFLNPISALSDIGYSLSFDWTAKVQYLIYLFGPFLFLPFLSRSGAFRFLPGLPWLAIVVAYSPLLSQGGVGTPYTYSQWSSFILPYVFVSAVYAAANLKPMIADGWRPRMAPDYRHAVAVLLAATVVLSVSTGVFSPISPPIQLSGGDSTVPTDYNPSVPLHGVWPTPVADSQELAYYVSLLPENASVLTQNDIGSKLWQRTSQVIVFYQPGYNNTVALRESEAIIVDYNLPGYCSSCISSAISDGTFYLYKHNAQVSILIYLRSAA